MHELLRGGPPTVELLRPVAPDVPSDERVQQVLDLCMGFGEVLLSSGESAEETSATMMRVAAACGLPTVDVDITFTAITMCCHRGKDVVPLMTMRLVRYRAIDLTRLAETTRIVARVERGRMGVSAAAAALSEVVEARHPYPRWVATAGWAGLAAAAVVLLGGGPVIAVWAFVVSALIDRIGRVLARWGVVPFFLQMVGAMVASVSTLGLFAVGALPPATQPSLVIAASITVLLSGMSFVGTVQDAISGYYVTAAGRATEIAMLSAGLLTGVVLGLKVGLWFGLTLDPVEQIGGGVARFGILTAAGAVAAAMFALASYARPRALVHAALAGAVGWAVYGALTLFAGFGPVVSTGIAATVVGVASGLSRRGSGVNAGVITMAGIIPLLPGLTAYRGFYQLAVQGVGDGLVSVSLASAIALALAAGMALGNFLARPRQEPARSSPAIGETDAE